VKTELEALVLEVLTALGFDLVELAVKGSRQRPVFDIRIEKKDGEKVTINDCAAASRAIEERIEPVASSFGNYVLEVSSPGLERRLNRPQDWRRFVGRPVSVLAPVLRGRHELDLIAVEGDEGSEVAVLKDKKGSDIRVPLAEVKEARLVFHWKR
jgi:ribosome maturation factor RimP